MGVQELSGTEKKESKYVSVQKKTFTRPFFIFKVI